MGLRPTHGNENATVRHRRINGLWRAFNRAVLPLKRLVGRKLPARNLSVYRENAAGPA
jgi:hypothetical protein